MTTSSCGRSAMGPRRTSRGRSAGATAPQSRVSGSCANAYRRRIVVGGGGKANVTTAAVCLPVHNLVDGAGPHSVDESASLGMAAARSSGNAFEDLGRRELERARELREEMARLGDSCRLRRFRHWPESVLHGCECRQAKGRCGRSPR